MKKKNLTFLECMLADHNIFSDRLRLNKEWSYYLLSDTQSLWFFDAKDHLQQLAQTWSEDQIISFLGWLMIGYGDMIVKQTGDTSTLIGAKIFVPLIWNIQWTHEYRKKMIDYLALRGFQIGYTIIQQKYDMLQIHCTDPLIIEFWKTVWWYQYDHNIFVDRQKNIAELFQSYCTQHAIVMKNDWSYRIRVLDVDRI
jgi:hypothetical protein